MTVEYFIYWYGGHDYWLSCYGDSQNTISSWMVPGTFDDNGDCLPEYKQWWMENM